MLQVYGSSSHLWVRPQPCDQRSQLGREPLVLSVLVGLEHPLVRGELRRHLHAEPLKGLVDRAGRQDGIGVDDLRKRTRSDPSLRRDGLGLREKRGVVGRP